MNDEKYLRELAGALRWRRLPTDRVDDMVREVAVALAESGRSPVEEFGTPRQYASQFPTGRTLHVGYVVSHVVAAVVVVGALLFLAERVRTGENSLPVTVGVTGAAWVVTMLAMYAGQVADRRVGVHALS